MSQEDTLGNHAVVRCKRGRPSKQTEARFDESSEFLNTCAEHSLGKRAAGMNESAEHSFGKRSKVTASSSEQQRGGYNEAREVIMSTDGDAITLDELRKGGVGCFTIKPPVTIASVGRRGSASFWLSPLYGMRKENEPEHYGEYVCVQDPYADTKAKYRLRILLKQDDICMWSTAFDDVAESILGISVEDFEALNDVGKKTVVWGVIGMKCSMTITKEIYIYIYTNYVIESMQAAGYLPRTRSLTYSRRIW